MDCSDHRGVSLTFSRRSWTTGGLIKKEWRNTAFFHLYVHIQLENGDCKHCESMKVSESDASYAVCSM